jgi:hypothetical protein
LKAFLLSVDVNSQQQCSHPLCLETTHLAHSCVAPYVWPEGWKLTVKGMAEC